MVAKFLWPKFRKLSGIYYIVNHWKSFQFKNRTMAYFVLKKLVYESLEAQGKRKLQIKG